MVRANFLFMTTIWLLFSEFFVCSVLQLEHFCEAFTKLDDVYRESGNAEGYRLDGANRVAIVGVLFYLFERDNLN